MANHDNSYKLLFSNAAMVADLLRGFVHEPKLRHFLLDEQRIADAELEPLKNLAAALFQLGKDRGPEDFQRVIGALAEWLSDPAMAELHRAFRIWIQAYLRERLGGVDLPEFESLMEVKAMLGQNVVPWTERWKQEGRKEDLLALQEVLLRNIESRFGGIPDTVRRRIAALDSVPGLEI